MNDAVVPSIRRWLEDYARAHGWAGTAGPRMLEIKMEHTLRVAADCVGIARDLGWSGDRLIAAQTVGLLHDVARFPQFQKYRTLIDRDSINHGEHGYEVLRSQPVLDAFPADGREAILSGVRYHNRKHMPPDLPTPARDLLTLVRDADKLDILQVIRDVAEADDYDNHPELLLGKDKQGPPSPVLIREILDTRTGSYENVYSLMDLNLLRLTWAYDLNHAPSLRRLRERDLYRDLMTVRNANPDVEEIKRRVREFLAASAPVS